jgi:hypothetical protein
MPSLVSLATVADVQDRAPQPLTDAERDRASVLIADASAIVVVKVPDLPQPPPATAVGVICTAVLRALASPADGNKSETVGTYTRTAAHEGGGLYLTDEELDLLRAPRPAPRGAFTIWTVPPTPQAGGGG